MEKTLLGFGNNDYGVSHLVQRHNLFTYFTTQKFFLRSKICKQIMSLDQMRDAIVAKCKTAVSELKARMTEK